MVRDANTIYQLVIVPKENTWNKFDRFGSRIVSESSKDYEESQGIFNTEATAQGYMTFPSQTEGLYFESLEDVDEKEIERLTQLFRK